MLLSIVLESIGNAYLLQLVFDAVHNFLGQSPVVLELICHYCYGNDIDLPLEASDAVALSKSIGNLPLFSLMSARAPCDDKPH